MLSDTLSLSLGGDRAARIRREGAAIAAALILAATALVLTAAALILPAAAQAGSVVTLSPEPGTPDASPTTQISVLGVRRSAIRGVRVTGSISGSHRGRLRAYRGEPGASFLLARPLVGGERVRVHVTVAGHPAAASQFTVARLAPTPPVLSASVIQPGKLQHFASQPTLLAPRITVLKRSSRLRGDIFLTPLPSPVIHPESDNALTIHPVGPGGPMIIDSHGRLVWFDQLPPPLVATNFRPQRYAGHEVLTWWQGSVTLSAFGIGEGVIADSSYRVLRTVKTGNGYTADLHEFLLTPNGEALFTAYSPVLAHLPGTATGKLSPLLDSIVQEVDVRTGLVVWEWHGLGHIPLADSYATPATSATDDVYHLNSVEPAPGGRLLISARDTSAVYLIDRATGRIVWTLGGKASSFRLGRGARFYFQHDAGFVSGNVVSLFDDEAGPPLEGPYSRGIRLALDTHRHTATLLREFHRPAQRMLAESEGSVQNLAGGGVFVGFGSTPFFSEFSPSGKLVFDARLPTDDGSYREFTYPWRATPATRPTLALTRTSSSRVVAHVSWNGATAVARWELLALAPSGTRTLLSTVRATGFETAIPVTRGARRFAVRALAADGRTLATSTSVSLP